MPTRSISGLFNTFRERLLSGFVWNLVSVISLQGSVLLTGGIVARLIGLESFGAYAVLVSTVMTIAGVAKGGTGLFATKYIAEFLPSDPARVARILRLCAWITWGTGMFTAAVLLVLAPVIAQGVFGRPELELALQLVAFATVGHVVVAYQYGALQGFGAFRRISQAGVSAGAVHIIASSIGAWAGGLNGALVGFLFASLWRIHVFGRNLRAVTKEHDIPAPGPTMPADWQAVLHFGVPAAMSSWVTLPCLWGVTVLVARHPEGLAWAGIFAVAHQLRLTVLQLPSLLNSVSFSVLSKLRGANDQRQFRQVFRVNMAVSLLISTLFVAVIGWNGEWILGLYGPKFMQGNHLLILLLVSVLPEMLGLSTYQLVQSAGRMWQSLLLIVAPRDLLYLLLAFVWLPAFGITGAAWAYIAAQTLGCLCTLAIARTSSTRYNA